jgi:hypothetical protein
LFDNLIQRCESTGKYPYVTFFHLEEAFKMGMVDWVGRSDNLMLASGIFDETEIAQAMIEAIESDPEYWGSSICYWPIERMKVEVIPGIEIPVYVDGEFEEISILPEQEANCLFTSLKMEGMGKVSVMEQRLIDAILKLAGGNKALADELVERADKINFSIEDKKLITQATESIQPPAEEPVIVTVSDPVAEELEVPAPADESTPNETKDVIEITEEMMSLITESAIASPKFGEKVKEAVDEASDKEVLPQLRQALDELKASYDLTVLDLKTRLESLEKSDTSKKTEWLADLPKNAASKTTVIVRPSQKHSKSDKDEKESLAAIAEETLSKVR